MSVWDSFWHVLIILYTWKIEICSICSMTFCLSLCAMLLPECRNLGTFSGLILAWEHCLVSCQMWWRGKEVDIIKCFPLQPTHPLCSWLNNYWPGVTEVEDCTPVVRCRAKHRNPHFCSVQVRWSGHLPTANLSIRRGKMGAKGSSWSQWQLLPGVASSLCVICKST